MEFTEDDLFDLSCRHLRKQSDQGKIHDYESISSVFDSIAQLMPVDEGSYSREKLIQELVKAFCITTIKRKKLTSEIDHKPWLTPERKKGRKYWPRYYMWQQQDKHLPESALIEQDESSDEILGLLEDPRREGPWDRRGLAVGHVQSGKTGNYCALINKAADAGYKIIIVLTGMLENLRCQTQIRLDEAFLGYESLGPQDTVLKDIGVGRYKEVTGVLRPITYTFRTEDFKKKNVAVQKQSEDSAPWLFVVKKNGSILRNLLSWLRNSLKDSVNEVSGDPLITSVPVLIIDDEADNASLDTGNPLGSDGQYDPDYEPKTINRLIRQLLMAFSRKSYVGYTATPFANIFVHSREITTKEGPDLFPSSFIVNLGSSSNYIGPALLFGVGKDAAPELDLIREADDAYKEVWQSGKLHYSGWMPPKHKKEHRPLFNGKKELPDSLKEAVRAFILAYVCRIWRGQGNKHSSMLIHVTRFQNVQKKVCGQVSAYLHEVRNCLEYKLNADEYQRLIAEFKDLWERDFIPTTSDIASKADLLDDLCEPTPKLPEWPWVESALAEHIADIEVREINGSCKDALDYEEHKEQGFKVIAVGGDKLSRGLTLEGLTVSYFLRPSRMYDSLMQMGRWYGYRPGYVDLCRLYTSSELIEWFGFISEATKELRDEFTMMANRGATPKEFGLRVKQHPAMLITSQLKMQTATTIAVSFGGRMPETVTFFSEEEKRQANIKAVSSLLAEVSRSCSQKIEAPGVPKGSLGGVRKLHGILFKGVAPECVRGFLDLYQCPPEAARTNPKRISEYIEKMQGHGELTDWDVYLNTSGRDADRTWDCGELAIPPFRLAQRQLLTKPTNRFSIRRMLGSREEELCITDQETWDKCLELTKELREESGKKAKEGSDYELYGPAIRKLTNPKHGLLIVYVLDINNQEDILTRDCPAVGFAISFPDSQNSENVEYKANEIAIQEDEND